MLNMYGKYGHINNAQEVSKYNILKSYFMKVFFVRNSASCAVKMGNLTNDQFIFSELNSGHIYGGKLYFSEKNTCQFFL